MSTKVYGQSDDLIEFEGDLDGEVAQYGTDDMPLGVIVGFSDGTVLSVKYGKPGLGGVWAITVLNAGTLFDRLDVCTNNDADPYSDIAHFKDGKLAAWTNAGKVK